MFIIEFVDNIYREDASAWMRACWKEAVVQPFLFSIYTLSDLGVLSNLIGSLSLANEHYSPPTSE